MAEILLWQQERNTNSKSTRVMHFEAGKEYAKHIIGVNIPYSRLGGNEEPAPQKINPSELVDTIQKAIQQYAKEKYTFKILSILKETRVDSKHVNLDIREYFLTITKDEFDEVYKEALKDYIAQNNFYAIYLMDYTK